MTEKKKKQILLFAKEGFKKFYSEHYVFLSERKYKPGKRTYRNLLSLNKMMDEFLKNPADDYVKKSDVIKNKGWKGPSSYVQHERIITNFDLSETSWTARERSVLVLNDDGLKLRKKYADYKRNNPAIDLNTAKTLPQFAINYMVKSLKNTNSQNMTLWKNTIISALYLYCDLGYMPKTSLSLTQREKQALIHCCNYVEDDGITPMDSSYLQQPIAMLKNLNLLDSKNKLTDSGYKLLQNMKMFSEIESSISDYKDVLGEDIKEVEEILELKRSLVKVAAPERKTSKVINTNKRSIGPKNVNFEKLTKENKITGNLGEKLVLDYERKKLERAGIKDVEEKVFLTSERQKEYGNAYPCDIISLDEKTGDTIFIEVKTTKGSAETPFYLSEEELQFSINNDKFYRLYRVFNIFNKFNPEFYCVEGSVNKNFHLEYDRYIATRTL